MTVVNCHTEEIRIAGSSPPQIAALLLGKAIEILHGNVKSGRSRLTSLPQHVDINLKKYTVNCTRYRDIPTAQFFMDWIRRQESAFPLESGEHFLSHSDLNSFIDREKNFAIATVGCCGMFVDIRSIEILDFGCTDIPGVQIIGAESLELDSFHRDVHLSGLKSTSSSGHWIIPRFEMLLCDGSLFVSLYGVVSTDNLSDFEISMEVLRTLNWCSNTAGMFEPHELPPIPASVKQIPTYEKFRKFHEETLHPLLENGNLKKVVISRIVRMHFESDLSGATILMVLLKKFNQDLGRRYLVYLRSKKYSITFISMSPERLCRVDGYDLITEAVAGTWLTDSSNLLQKPNGEDSINLPRPSSYSAPALSISDVPCSEYKIVFDFIKSKLEERFGEVSVTELEVVNLRRISHYYQKIRASCTTPENNEKGLELVKWFISNVHPTPAICGTPLRVSSSLISGYEFPMMKKDDGSETCFFHFYRGATGVVSSLGGELCVGIRCAHIYHESNDIIVHGGSGITKDSNPSREWVEQYEKMLDFISVFVSAESQSAMSSIIDPIGETCTQNKLAENILIHSSRVVTGEVRHISNPNMYFCSIIVDEFRRCGIDHFVICPGSRNTSLALAILRHPYVSSTMFCDERGGAFYASGYSKATQSICGVLVTSGTAVANLVAAATEARQSSDDVKLLFLTADRPFEEHNCGVDQTADHIREPFLSPNTKGNETLRPLSKRLVKWQENSSSPFSRYTVLDRHVPNDLVVELCDPESSIIIITGSLVGEIEALFAFYLSEILGAVLLADIQSKIRRRLSPDILLRSDRLLNLLRRANIVLILGGSVISKRLFRFIREIGSESSVKVIRIATSNSHRDPLWVIDTSVHSTINELCQAIVTQLSLITVYTPGVYFDISIPNRKWDEVDHIINLMSESLQRSITNMGVYSEPRISFELNAMIGNDIAFFVGSSMPCRDMDTFEISKKSPFLLRNVSVNRGTNGIDGVISSSIGYSVGLRGRKVICFLGDISAIHDISSLAALSILTTNSRFQDGHTSSPNILVVVLNNSGAGIFNFLGGINDRELVSAKEYKYLFELTHDISLARISSSMGLKHWVARKQDMSRDSLPGFCRILESILEENKNGVLEIFPCCTKEQNVQMHDIDVNEVDFGS